MADFDINITEPPSTPVVYTQHTGYYAVLNCDPYPEVRRNVKVVSTDNTYGIVTTYSGDNWKYLTIKNISLPSCCLTLEYLGNPITNSDLPLKIDIEALSGINNIPNLEVVANGYEVETENNSVKSINITFDIEDINGTKGSLLLSSFQIILKRCLTVSYQTPNIISPLSGTVGDSSQGQDPNNLIFEYYIRADAPVTSYSASGLPINVSVYNPQTGYVRIDCTTLQQRLVQTVIQFDISATHDQAVPTTDTETFTLTIPAYLEQYY